MRKEGDLSWFEFELRAKGPTVLLLGSFILSLLGVIIAAFLLAGAH